MALSSHRPTSRRELLTARLGVMISAPELGDVPAVLEDLDLDGTLGVHLEAGDLSGLRQGESVWGRFTRANDAAYTFRCEVVEVRADSYTQLRLTWPTMVERQQSRRTVRLPIALEVTFALAGPRRLSAATGPAWSTGTTADISGSGLALVTDEVLPAGATLLAHTVLPARKGLVQVDSRARIVRHLDHLQHQAGQLMPCHWYGLEYVDMSQRDEEVIVASVLWHLATARLA